MIESGLRISLKSNYLDHKGGKRCGQDTSKLNTKNKTKLRYQITKGSLALLSMSKWDTYMKSLLFFYLLGFS